MNTYLPISHNIIINIISSLQNCFMSLMLTLFFFKYIIPFSTSTVYIYLCILWTPWAIKSAVWSDIPELNTIKRKHKCRITKILVFREARARNVVPGSIPASPKPDWALTGDREGRQGLPV